MSPTTTHTLTDLVSTPDTRPSEVGTLRFVGAPLPSEPKASSLGSSSPKGEMPQHQTLPRFTMMEPHPLHLGLHLHHPMMGSRLIHLQIRHKAKAKALRCQRNFST